MSALTGSSKDFDRMEVHDPSILAAARQLLDDCPSPREMAHSVVAAVKRNEEWRGKRCINLLAPEAPTSPTVRALLSAEVGTRAAEGHIGAPTAGSRVRSI
jgi:glycine hydroxymethyltransferase